MFKKSAKILIFIDVAFRIAGVILVIFFTIGFFLNNSPADRPVTAVAFIILIFVCICGYYFSVRDFLDIMKE